MVWPWTSWDDDGSTRDPMRDLDPSLRAFLEQESPIRYSSSSEGPKQPPTKKPPTKSSDSPPEANYPTLFKDNRYAHLWKTYRPLNDIEFTNSSAQDKLKDVLTAYRDRKASIGNAAIENCSEEQADLHDCYRHGDFSDRMMTCNRFVKRLERCYQVNQRLLRALGYLSAWDRPDEVEESIQMHADKLFQNMIRLEEDEKARDKALQEARRRGEVVVMTDDSRGKTAAEREQNLAKAKALRNRPAEAGLDDAGLPAVVEKLRPRVREMYKDKLISMKPEDRALEERALAMEMIAGRDVARKVIDLQRLRLDEKAERQKKGKATLGDTVSTWFGW